MAGAPTRAHAGVGAVVALVGEALRIWAAGHLEKGREVTASGPYRFTRHPLYLGSALIGVGLAIASASVVVGVLVLAVSRRDADRGDRTEEAHLTEKFGARVSQRIAKAARRRRRARRFSLARAMRNREYRAMIGLAAALALLVVEGRIIAVLVDAGGPCREPMGRLAQW